MSEPKLENPHYIDLEKTQVGVTLVFENGVKQNAVFKVPPDGEKGINPYWDRILDEFDEKAMRKERNDLEVKRIQENNFRNKKLRSSNENLRLRTLFDKKMKAFEFPFVKNASNEDKAAVRRSPDEMMLNLVLTALAIKYLQDNSMSFIDLFDRMDEEEENNK